MFDKEKYLQMKAEKKTLSEMAEVFGITRKELSMDLWVIGSICFFVGSFFGMVLTALIAGTKDEDDDEDRH